MGNEFFHPKKPPQIEGEGHEKLDPHKVPFQLPPPLTGFATRDASGVDGESSIQGQPGVSASHSGGGDALFADSPTGIAVHARSTGNLAGLFDGHVQVTGSIELLGADSDIILRNEDCAEQFDVAMLAQPGMVMVINDQGLLQPSTSEYDKRVAGVVSGAGSFRPAMTLGVRESAHKRMAIAMVGKVACMVNARHRPIRVGDLLASSAVEGHAMAVDDTGRAFGTVIGKALAPLASGLGLIPILVALQ